MINLAMWILGLWSYFVGSRQKSSEEHTGETIEGCKQKAMYNYDERVDVNNATKKTRMHESMCL